MSELHGDDERPDQYNVPCRECGTDIADKKRMHSYLREKHLAGDDELPDWDDDVDQVQCNVCGNIRKVR